MGNNEDYKYDTRVLMDTLNLLKAGMIKHSLDKNYLDKISYWCDHIEEYETIVDISQTLNFDTEYYSRAVYIFRETQVDEDTQMAKYIFKNIECFVPQIDIKEEMAKNIDNIKTKAKQFIEKINNNESLEDREIYELDSSLKTISDKLLRENLDVDLMVLTAKLRNHLCEKEYLEMIINTFSDKKVYKFLIDIAHLFYIQPNKYYVKESLSHFVEEIDRIISHYNYIHEDKI